MSFLNPDVKTASAPITELSSVEADSISQLFKEIEKEQEWDQLFIDYAKIPKQSKSSPLMALYLTIRIHLGKVVATQMSQEMDKCSMYALNKRLTKKEQDDLLEVLKSDVIRVKPELKDQKISLIKWDNIYQEYTQVIGDPQFSDRVIDILTRYDQKLGIAITSMLEQCIKKNFLQKLSLQEQQLIMDRIAKIIKSITTTYENSQAIRKKKTLYQIWSSVMDNYGRKYLVVSKYQDGKGLTIAKMPPPKHTKKWFNSNISIASNNEESALLFIEDLLIDRNSGYGTEMLLLEAADNAREWFRQKALVVKQ